MLMDTAIITPWVAAADDPTTEAPSNHPQLMDDYAHVTEVTETLIEEVADLQAGLARAESEGRIFRSLGMQSVTGDAGFGVRLPHALWDQLKADLSALGAPMNSWIAGPSLDPAEDQIEVFRLMLTVLTEGVRLFEDKTGQPAANLIPGPNQYTVRAVMEESVLQLIENDARYWYMTGVPFYAGDPENPIPPDPSQSPLSLPPWEPMSQTRYDQYMAWQDAQGVPVSFVAAMMTQANPTSTLPTNAEATIETAAWQSTIPKDDSTADPFVLPTAEIIEKLRRKALRYLTAAAPATT